MEKEMEAVEELESNSTKSTDEPTIPAKEINGKLQSNWVENLNDDNGDYVAQEMNPIATDRNKSQNIILV